MFLESNYSSMKDIYTKIQGNRENSKWLFSAQASGFWKMSSNENTVLLTKYTQIKVELNWNCTFVSLPWMHDQENETSTICPIIQIVF